MLPNISFLTALELSALRKKFDDTHIIVVPWPILNWRFTENQGLLVSVQPVCVFQPYELLLQQYLWLTDKYILLNYLKTFSYIHMADKFQAFISVRGSCHSHSPGSTGCVWCRNQIFVEAKSSPKTESLPGWDLWTMKWNWKFFILETIEATNPLKWRAFSNFLLIGWGCLKKYHLKIFERLDQFFACIKISSKHSITLSERLQSYWNVRAKYFLNDLAGDLEKPIK